MTQKTIKLSDVFRLISEFDMMRRRWKEESSEREDFLIYE